MFRSFTRIAASCGGGDVGAGEASAVEQGAIGLILPGRAKLLRTPAVARRRRRLTVGAVFSLRVAR